VLQSHPIHKLVGSRHAPADWIRQAQIIELSWARTRVPAIAAKLGCSPKTVRCWVGRFTRQGLDGLADRP
jgi:transposase